MGRGVVGSVVQSERDQGKTMLEKAQCVWKVTKKFSIVACSKTRQAKKILTAKARREKALFRNSKATEMVRTV